MNQDVHPITALFVILISICLIGFIFWARGETLRVGGPDQVQYDHDGNIFIHIADTLYKFSPDFKHLQKYDLPQLGVYDLVGDFAFFSNGDMLIRRGKYQPGLLESIRRYMRQPDTKEPLAKLDNEGLYRCTLELRQCSAFGSGHVQQMDFTSAFHLSIDPSTDTVYLSDTDRHKLRKFDAEGKQLAVQDKGYKFPNQNMLYDGKLLVADTNHHAVQVTDSSDDKFGEILKTHYVTESSLGAKKWTYSFAHVGGNWWVNNMDGGMSHGAVAIFDNQWRFIEKIQLPQDADPIDFVVLNDRVLITDLNNLRIYQLDYKGQLLHEALPSVLSEKLDALLNTQQNYRKLTVMAIVLFVLFLVMGFVIAIVKGRSQVEPELVLSAEEQNFSLRDPHIEWISKNKQKVRAFQFAMFMPLLAIPLVIALFFLGKETALPENMPYMEIGVILLVMVISPVFLKKFLAMEIGVLGDILVIKSGKDYAVGKGKNIFYSDTYLVIGKQFLPFNMKNMIFDTQQVIQKVMPLLREATYVKTGQMMNMLLKRQKPQTIVMTFIAVTIIVGLLLGNIYK